VGLYQSQTVLLQSLLVPGDLAAPSALQITPGHLGLIQPLVQLLPLGAAAAVLVVMRRTLQESGNPVVLVVAAVTEVLSAVPGLQGKVLLVDLQDLKNKAPVAVVEPML